MMTERERVLALLRGGRPDRVPWFGDLDYWATALIGRGRKPPDFKASDAYIDWHRDLRVGFYLQGYFPFRAIIEGCRIADWAEGHARRRRIETPRGTLTETWTWLPESFAEAPTEHLVKSATDLAAYRSLFEHTRYEPDYAFAETRARQAGDQGIVLCYLPKSPFMQMVALDAGIAAVAEIAADAPDELRETLAVVRAAHDRAAQIAVSSPAEVLMIPENLSSEVVGPRFYELYMRDYHERWSREISAAGKFSCVHLDGTLRGLLRQVAGAGFTFIEAMTPAPVGDLAVDRWAEWCGSGGSRTVFWGGLPGSYFTDKVSDTEFERHTREVLRIMSSEPRYVLGVADQVPPDGLERRVRRVAELRDEYPYR
jgi:uroporphyrinogen-III decarboxylase